MKRIFGLCASIYEGDKKEKTVSKFFAAALPQDIDLTLWRAYFRKRLPKEGVRLA
ncbi:MAG: hypothetical protein ACREBC_14260 [Pyrinomonadaceae bacterium]